MGDGEKKQFDTILFNDKSAGAADCEITETAWLVRPAVATTLMPEKPSDQGGAPGGGASGGAGGGGTTGCRLYRSPSTRG